MNGGASDLRWSNYVLERGDALVQFWRQLLAERERRILVIVAKGFDPRMCLGLEMLVREQGGRGQCDVVVIEYDEGVNSPSHEYRDLVRANVQRLEAAVKRCGEIKRYPMSIRSSDGRRIASHAALNLFSNLEPFKGYTDIVLDISAAPRGIYLPLAAKMLHLLDNVAPGEPVLNFHVFVWEDSALDAAIQDEGVEETADYIAGFRGGMDREATAGQPSVWIPLLGENQRTQLERIYDRVSPDEICPVLPSPSRDPRRGDNLVSGYHRLLFDAWRVQPRNFIYCSEQNPFEVYRQVTRVVNAYRESFRPIGEAKFVLSALSSKLLSLGALLTAYDFKSKHFEVAIAHVDCYGYRIHGALGPNAGELFGIWLAGECDR